MIKHRLAQIIHSPATETMAGSVSISPAFSPKKLILLVTGFWFLVTNCFAAPVSSKELIENAAQYDGKTVVYKGEVIGDIMVRKGFAWLNVNDGINAIGIWLSKDLIKDILYTGSYKSRGDIIEVKGVFHRACHEHGGDLDIHIEEMRKISSGMVIKETVDVAKRKIAFILLVVLCIVGVLSYFRQRHGIGRF